MALVAAKPPKPTGPLVKGLPVYTKQQFLQVRPKGSYQGYLNYINRKRGAQPGAAGAAKPGGTPTYDSLLRGVQIETPAQLEARAKRMTETDITSQTTLIREDAEAAAKKAHERALALAAAGRAAAGMNAGLFSAVGGEYNAAAGELSRLGQLSGGMAAQTAADVAAENAELANVGAPGVEAAGVMAGPGQAGVEGYRGGTLAAQNFNTQGQAATFGLAGLISAQNLRATQEANLAYNQRAAEIQEARTKAVTEISRGRPELAQKYLLQLQDAQRQQIALAMSLIEARNARGDQLLTNTVTRAEEERAKETHGQEITAGNVEIAGAKMALQEIDITKSQALGYVVKKNGKPLLKNGKKIPYSVLAAQLKDEGKGADGLTPNERQKRDDARRDEARRFRYGSRTITLGNGQKKTIPAYLAVDFDPNNPETWGTPQNYWSAVKGLRQKGMTTAGAQELLKEYYGRGEGGAPIFYKAERAEHTKRYGKAGFERILSTVRRLIRERKFDEADEIIEAVNSHRYVPPPTGVRGPVG